MSAGTLKRRRAQQNPSGDLSPKLRCTTWKFKFWGEEGGGGGGGGGGAVWVLPASGIQQQAAFPLQLCDMYGHGLELCPGSPTALLLLIIPGKTCCTMRFGSTAKVLLKCKLKYYRISECVVQRPPGNIHEGS